MNVWRTPEELKTAGERSYQQGDHLEAAALFQAAAESYQHQDDRLAAAEMASNRSVALLQAGDAQAALEAVQGIPELFAGAGDTRREALALGNQAAALQALKRYPEAEAVFLRSAELLSRTGESELRASVMRSLSELQLRTGRQLEAVASMQAGLDGLEKPNLKQRLIKKMLRMPFKVLSRS